MGLSMPYALHETIGVLNDMIALHNYAAAERERESGNQTVD
nr:MAG TPA: hypothetical protein [Caudoviricetes sp.]